jgi:antitoxin component YwqK of YwqJK toxin-antitoxin module
VRAFGAIAPCYRCGMDGVPQRPAVVPAGAVWVAGAGEWREGAVDGAGAKQGLHRSWRADGSLRDEVTFVDDKAEGRYRRLHPNGDLASAGEFQQGEMQGTLVAYASDAPTPELLQSCCVPPNAWQLQTDFDGGQVMGRRWYNRAGVQILENGEPRPPRPAAVPEAARYDESAGRWVVGAYDAQGTRSGRWARWSKGGLLVEEEELEAGVRHGVWRTFSAESGALEVERRYQRGLRDGPCRDRRLVADGYLDPRAASEEGAFERDQAVGPWILRDAAGAIIARRDLGVAVDEETLAGSRALAAGAGTAGEEAAPALAELARALLAERRVGESIIAMARSAARSGTDGALRAFLAAAAWPRSPAAGHEIATAAIKTAGESLAPLVDALVRGGDAVALLRAIASSAKGAFYAAHDIVDAALLLAQSETGDVTGAMAACHVTRALVNLHLGDLESARADIGRLPAEREEQRLLMLDYIRVLSPRFEFWPARTAIETLFQEFPAAPAQPLQAVRATIQKYATRLGLIRAALIGQLGDRTSSVDRLWLPPELPELLPDGPVALGAWHFQQSLEGAIPAGENLEGASPAGENLEGGAPEALGESEEIAVDERLALESQTIPTLLRLARREWAALCWLCWSSGLDHVALPAAATPPASFGQAAGMAVERTWRCRDKLTSGGLVAMTKGVPGFEWEGIHIDLMPRILVEIMTEEQIETRALFCWLCDPAAQSPWQSDLRDSD